jgi:putative membrane protein
MARFLRILLILFALNAGYLAASVAAGRMPPVILFPLATFLPFTFAVLHAGKRLCWKGMAAMLGISFLVSLLFESVGVATGWVYGPYHYTDMLGPKLLGLVPLFVPLGWFLMSYPAFIIADWIAPTGGPRVKRALVVAALAALAMTAWDLVMDPARVHTGMWVWEAKGPYFGIPLQNFLGWWLTTFAALALFQLLARYAPPARRDAPFDRLAVISYGLIALAEVISAWVLGLGGPALAGFFATLPWFLWGWFASSDS